MMWKAAIIFVVIFVMSMSIVNNLYQSFEIKELKEKLSWYTTRMDPVSLASEEDAHEES